MKATGPIPAGFEADTRGMLRIGGRPADALVEEAGGTPLFVYDRDRIARQVAAFRAAMPAGVALHYAVKANPHAPLLQALDVLVDGFDIASAGEWDRLAAIGTSRPVSFAGPGKSDRDLERAIGAGVTIHLESEGEAVRAIAIARRLSIRPRLSVRVNPPFALKGAGMAMGGRASPFGVDHDRAAALVGSVLASGAEWRGLHIFAGSQSLSAEAIAETQAATIALAGEIAAAVRHSPPEVNIGGGFGIPYAPGDRPLDLEMVGTHLAKVLKNRPESLSQTRFAVELGRWLVGEAGVYLARIVDRKRSGDRVFLITDGGMHHMLAATGNLGQLLRRNYPVAIAGRFGAAAEEVATITGCLCTPIDMLAESVGLPRAEPGDLVAIFCAGAYGRTASPETFLGHPAAREMLVGQDPAGSSG